MSDEQLVALMANAAMFLFPSMTEGFGLPPLEAMLLGSATICALAGAMPEVCGPGAIYVPPGDAAGWRSAIDGLWNDIARRQELAAAGREHASHYRWRDAARLYLDLLVRESRADMHEGDKSH